MELVRQSILTEGFVLVDRILQGAPLSSWEAAVVRKAGQKLVGALDWASGLSYPAAFAHW